jgi:hypothetical protein
MSKSSKNITLSLVITLASLVIGCDSNTSKVCTDDQGNIVDSSKCNDSEHNSLHGYYPYRWYYTSRSNDPIGSHATGGSYTAPESGISRGGFGSSAGGFGAGE